MNPISKEIRIDLAHPGGMDFISRVYAVRGDTGSRTIRFALYSNGEKYNPASDIECKIAGIRFDGSIIPPYNSIKFDDTSRSAYEISQNILTVYLSNEVCKKAGEVELTVEMSSPDGSNLNLWATKCQVEPSAVSTAEESPDLPSESATTAADRAEEAARRAEAAAERAELHAPETYVSSVNGQTGVVNLTAQDVGAVSGDGMMLISDYDENGNGMVDTAEKTTASLTIRMNGGTTEGVDQFTFNGSSDKVVDISATTATIGGGLRMTKAWENASPNANFAPQSIILPALSDGSKYEAILVHYKPDKLFKSFDDSALIFPGTYTSVRNYVIGNTYKDVEIYTRQIAYNILSDGSMKVTVENCVYYPDSSNTSYANNLIVPTAIYGVSGIS